MAQLIEFAGNHLILVSAFAVITALIIKTEIDIRMSNVTQLNVNDAVRLLNDDNVVILDVRESNEYQSGHLREAIHIPMSSLNKRIGELDKYRDRPILAYCRSGSRSNSACRTLSKQGFEKVNNLAGGMIGWASANLPISKK